MAKTKNYKKTLIACYLGFITQAISANFVPLLFLTFKNTYGISLEMIALVPMVFYLTQLLVDLVATKFVDIIGYRTCVVISQVISSAGLILMAFLPDILPEKTSSKRRSGSCGRRPEPSTLRSVRYAPTPSRAGTASIRPMMTSATGCCSRRISSPSARSAARSSP